MLASTESNENNSIELYDISLKLLQNHVTQPIKHEIIIGNQALREVQNASSDDFCTVLFLH